MTQSKQYQIAENSLTLRVKPSPLFVRAVMFLLAFAFFLAPVSGILVSLFSGQGFHIGYLIGGFIFGVLGFYLLRIALWNTYGTEFITFHPDHINYIADYGWFKDGKLSLIHI